MRGRFTVSLVFAALMLFFPAASAIGDQSTLQAGAIGDDASRGNLGVRAEIRTHLYAAGPSVFDYFWVGTTLQNGAFIQFGYAFEPGYFCLVGSFVNGNPHCTGEYALLLENDARWQWQYWPNVYGSDFYYGIGPANSAGPNGTWRKYSIEPGPAHTVSFVIDGEQVAAIGFAVEPSREPPMVVAEKVATSNELGSLGPVEFRDISYLTVEGWHLVNSLVSISGCGIRTNCSDPSAYGVSLERANQIVAGSGGEVRKGGQLLWTRSYKTLNVSSHPRVKFHVTTITGDQEILGRGTVRVPEGMFADVWLTMTRTRSDGLMGLIGAVDRFQGWTGYDPSRNLSVRILMDQNKSLQATWHTDFGEMIWTSALVSASVGTILALVTLVLWRRSHRQMTFSNRVENAPTIGPIPAKIGFP